MRRLAKLRLLDRQRRRLSAEWRRYAEEAKLAEARRITREARAKAANIARAANDELSAIIAKHLALARQHMSGAEREAYEKACIHIQLEAGEMFAKIIEEKGK